VLPDITGVFTFLFVPGTGLLAFQLITLVRLDAFAFVPFRSLFICFHDRPLFRRERRLDILHQSYPSSPRTLPELDQP
jgi:hypothetical protein